MSRKDPCIVLEVVSLIRMEAALTSARHALSPVEKSRCWAASPGSTTPQLLAVAVLFHPSLNLLMCEMGTREAGLL